MKAKNKYQAKVPLFKSQSTSCHAPKNLCFKGKRIKFVSPEVDQPFTISD